MQAIGLTLLICFLWFVQGIGFVRWLMPELCAQTLVSWIVAAWLGLLTSLVVLVNLYFLLPFTGGQLALPVTLLLAVASIVAHVRSRRSVLRLDAWSLAVLGLSLIAMLLVLRPLLSQSGLGFYFSNNGEFSNYAAISDAVQFHLSSEPLGGLGLHSREAVLGLVCTVVSSLTGKSALWVIQPLAASLACLAFASLGLLFRHVAKARGLGRPASVVIGMVYAWAILSASAQCFWTLSFVSQYLAMALFLGGLVMLIEGSAPLLMSRGAFIGLLLAGLLVAYPEMVIPSAALLAAFELARADGLHQRLRVALALALALGVAAVLSNRLGLELMSRGSSIGSAGWNIYGPHRPVLGFVANVTGFTNPFAGPLTTSWFWPAVATVLVGGALMFAIIRARKAAVPTVRALIHLGWMFAAGLAVLFVIVARRGSGNNYIALKLIFNFGWIEYIVLAITISHLLSWRPRAWPIPALVLAVMLAGLAGPAVEFTKNLHRATKQALFLESEAERCRALLGPHPYVAANWFNYAIIGYFIAHEHDLYAADQAWPDGTGQQFVAGRPIVLVGRDFRLREEPRVSGAYLPHCSGRHFSVLAPANR